MIDKGVFQFRSNRRLTIRLRLRREKERRRKLHQKISQAFFFALRLFFHLCLDSRTVPTQQQWSWVLHSPPLQRMSQGGKPWHRMSPQPRPPPDCSPSRPQPSGSMALNTLWLSIKKSSTTPWYVRRHSWARTPRILRARGRGLLHKVRTLLQWNPEARGGGFITLTPCVPRYVRRVRSK